MVDVRTRQSTGRSLAIAAVCAILAANFVFGLTAMRRRSEAFRLAPGATVSDLYYRWLGTRQLLFDGVNPYTPAAAREGERGFYGRTLNGSEKTLDVENYLGFNYPLHLAVLLAPLAALPFPIVQVLAVVALAALIVMATAAWSRAVGWPVTRNGRLLACAAAVTSVPALDILWLQQPSGLVLGLLVFAILSLAAARRHGAAGAYVACATIKPQLVALPVAAAVAWALARPRTRWPFLAALCGTLAVLVGISLALLPSWPAWFLSNARAYASQVPQASLVGRLPAWPVRAVIAAAVVVITIGMPWIRRTREADARVLLDAFALSLAATLVISVADHMYDRVLLIPALLSLAAVHRSHRIARFSAAGVCARLVVATLAIVLAIGALLGVLLQVPGAVVPQVFTRVAFFCYTELPLVVWAALLLALARARSVTAARAVPDRTA